MATQGAWRRGNPTEPALGKIKPPTKFDGASFSNNVEYSVPDPSSIVDFVGQDVVLRTKDGVEYEGSFMVFRPETSTVVLRTVKAAKGEGANFSDRRSSRGKTSTLSLPLSHVQSLKSKGIHIQQGAKESQVASPLAGNGRSSTIFATDRDITSFPTDTDRAGAGRTLQRFDDFGPLSNTKLEDKATFGDDDLKNSKNESWDQFEENERLFGVRTSFDELQYTTKINRQDPKYLERQAVAERIAAEIEGRESSNSHVREERGLPMLESHGDEEDRFSGVRRHPEKSSTDSLSNLKAVDGSEKPVLSGNFTPLTQKRSYAAAASAGRCKKSPPPVSSQAPRPHSSPKNLSIATGRPGVSAVSNSHAVPRTAPTNDSRSSNRPSSQTGNWNERRAWSSGQVSYGTNSDHSKPCLSKVTPSVGPMSSSKVDTSDPESSVPHPSKLDRGSIEKRETRKPDSKLAAVVEKHSEAPKNIKPYEQDHDVQNIRKDTKLDSSLSNRPSPPVKTSDVNLRQLSVDSRSDKETGDTIATHGDAPDTSKQVEVDKVSDTQAAPRVEPKSPPKSPGEGESSGTGRRSTLMDTEVAITAKSIAKHEKLNANGSRFVFNPNAPEFLPSSTPNQDSYIGQPSTADAFPKQSARVPSVHLSTAVPQDFAMYGQDPSSVNVPVSAAAVAPGVGTSMPYLQGHYAPAGVQGYMPPNMMHMGQPMMHMNPVTHGSFPGVSRNPYGMPHQYQIAVGGGPPHPYAAAAPFGVPVPSSGIPMPSNQQRHGGYMPGPYNSYMVGQQHVPTQHLQPSQLPGSYVGYHSNGANMGRGGGGGTNRSRRGRGGHRASHQTHSQQ